VAIYPSSDPTETPIFQFDDPSGSSGLFIDVWDTHGVKPSTYYIGILGDYHGHDYGTITILPRDFSIQADVSEIYAGLPWTQSVTFTIYDHEGNPLANRPIEYVIKNNSTVVLSDTNPPSPVTTNADGRFSVTLPTCLDAGS